MMKNIFMSAMVFALALIVGCSKDETPEQTIKYKVNFEVAERSQDGTRAIKQSWKSGDQILIVFSNGDNWLNVNENTIKLTYNGSAWESEVNITEPLTGGKYTACHHMGEVSGDYWYGELEFVNYIGGEFLYSQKSEYTVNGDVIDLGTIEMQRDPKDFQISVTGLTGSNWELYFNYPNKPNYEDYFFYYLTRNSFKVYNGVVKYFTTPWKSAGIEYDGDVIFYFKKRSNIDVDIESLTFELTNGTDTYTYTKTGVTNETLVGGKAYTLPAEKFGITSNN